MWDAIKKWLALDRGDLGLAQELERLRRRAPIPVLWLFGKTQSGKTSMVRFLTGAEDAEIGRGFKPCTRFAREFQFPTAEAPLLTFLDTRGLEEPGYDCAEDLARFDGQAHVVIVTVKALDQALAKLVEQLGRIRRSRPQRSVVLAQTCLHEAYPQQQHFIPYPFGAEGVPLPELAPQLAEGLVRSLAEQRSRFAGLADAVVPLDLTPAAEGFLEPNYGGQRLKEVLLQSLPAAYRQTLLTLDEATRELTDLYARHAMPYIVGYSSLAASAGAIPVPWADLLVLPAIQARMIYDLAQLYGQPLSGERFLELASTLGLGLLMRQALREISKFLPFVGSVASAALAGAATFALGKAFCYYYSAIHKGHVPKAEELRRYYQEQLTLAEKSWRKRER